MLIHNNIIRIYTSTNKLACLISFDLLNETRMVRRVIFFDKLIRCFWIDIKGTLLTDGDVSSLLSILTWTYHWLCHILLKRTTHIDMQDLLIASDR